MKKIKPEVKKAKVIEVFEKETKNLGVDFIYHYGFREFYEDGTTLGVSSNKDWNNVTLDILFKTEMEKHYLSELVNAMGNIVNRGVSHIVRTRDQIINEFHNKLLSVEMCNSFIIYKKIDNLIRGYFFIHHPQDYKSLNFCVNNLPLFHKITNSIDYVIRQDKSIVEELLSQKFHLFTANKMSDILSQKKGLIPNTIIVFNNEEYSFTPKEIQLLEVIRSGGTIKDIAKGLGMEPRTVEWHLTNVKKKIGAFNKHEVITFAQTARVK